MSRKKMPAGVKLFLGLFIGFMQILLIHSVYKQKITAGNVQTGPILRQVQMQHGIYAENVGQRVLNAFWMYKDEIEITSEIYRNKNVVSAIQEIKQEIYQLKDKGSKDYHVKISLSDICKNENHNGANNIILFKHSLLHISEKEWLSSSDSDTKHSVELVLYVAFESNSKDDAFDQIAEFEILDCNGRQIDTFFSNRYGMGWWQGSLSYGSYAVKEIDTAAGYQINERCFGFKVNNEVNRVILINEGEVIVNRLITYQFDL